MNQDKINKLVKIKALLDNKNITEAEYNELKEEIIFKNQSVELTPENKISNYNNNQVNNDHYKRKTKNSLKPEYIIGIIFIICFLFFKILYSLDNENQDNNSSNTNSVTTYSEASNTGEICSICNKTFYHNGYNEDFNGNWNKCDESYQSQICSPTCGLKHVQNINNIANEFDVDLESRSSSGDLHMGNDGKLYENNKCGLCNGTGIEKNMSTLSDEYGRICPMCDGKGVRAY